MEASKSGNVCRSCGSKNDDDVRHCANCGADLELTVSPRTLLMTIRSCRMCIRRTALSWTASTVWITLRSPADCSVLTIFLAR
ncbi:MAG: hypothetical protein DMG68_05235 [Acidobacteria bacterium]|nr:MAG: hypothetical protein DMG68_05235 [Acidobacteriota bacterium]